MATKDIAAIIDDVVDRLVDSQHPDWLRMIDAARLDEPAEADPAPEEAVRPYRWLIDAVGDGVTLTSAGYLRPAMVTAGMTELGWADPGTGKQNREDQNQPVRSLRESSQRAGLLRKSKGRLLVTKNGARLAHDPAELWWQLVGHLTDAGEPAEQQAGVLYLLQVAAGDAEDGALLAAGLDILGWRRSDHSRLTPFNATYLTFSVRSGLGLLGARPKRQYDRAPSPPSPAAVRVARAALIGRSELIGRLDQGHASTTPTVPSGIGVRLEITLVGVEPPIWRRVEVPADYSLVQLDAVIQIAMGWQNSHLHRFEIDGLTYSEQLAEDPWPDQEFGDETSFTVGEAARLTGGFRYEYDFGDSWEHEIRVADAGIDPLTGPRVLDGARACPPEDCGGVWGYENLLAALSDPDHPEHQEFSDWVGGGFDPEAFDVERVNTSVVAYGRAQARRRRRRSGG